VGWRPDQIPSAERLFPLFRLVIHLNPPAFLGVGFAVQRQFERLQVIIIIIVVIVIVIIVSVASNAEALIHARLGLFMVQGCRHASFLSCHG
jgi:hypothetical protein